MLSTIVLCAVLVSLLLASFVLWSLCLRLGLRWARVPDVTTQRVVLTATIVFILEVALRVLFLSLSPSSNAQSTAIGLIQLVGAVVVPCAVICALFKVRFRRAFQAWLPTLLAAVMMLAIVLLVLRPVLYEAFVTPANGMAPTLLGRHWKGVCPECGKPNYCSPRDGRHGTAEPPLMICDGFHVTKALAGDQAAHSGDRFMVAKFLAARRWDLVVFRFPEEPATVYVKRLVGLPGEQIYIKDGSVWIDGVRQTPPDSVRGIEYLSEIPGLRESELWGMENRPALLGENEFFVLGDFSAQSNDSRLWRRGAPGHSPYAVPRSYIQGVVTHTYWPMDRWRIHR